MTMLEMSVGAIAIDRVSSEPIIVLKDADNRRLLPIWVGDFEARAIGLALRKETPTRPSTHQLFLSLAKKVGYSIREVAIHDMDSEAFKAVIHLSPIGCSADERRIELDSRPSDAIALALMAGAPVFVAAHILDQAGIWAESDQDLKEDREFKDFIAQVKASDFKGVLGRELSDDDLDNGESQS